MDLYLSKRSTNGQISEHISYIAHNASLFLCPFPAGSIK